MTTLNSEIAKNYFYADILYQIHLAEDKISYFSAKYKSSFDEFKIRVKSTSTEEFSLWDDYMEWKAFQNNYTMLINQKNDIENGNYKVA